jgi:hypothetical protein
MADLLRDNPKAKEKSETRKNFPGVPKWEMEYAIFNSYG